MNHPTSFTGTPGLASQHPAPTPASAPMYQGAVRRVLSRVVPTVTVYADGLVNLNTEASALFGSRVCLHQPPPVRAGRTPQPWQISVGSCNALIPVSKDKPAGSMRFRAEMGCCPPEGRYTLAPIVGHPTRFLLVQG